METSKLERDRLVRTVAKGAGVVFLGTAFARVLGYLIRAGIARGFGQEFYGLYSTGLALFTVVVAVALFGVPYALPRQISFHVAKGEWRDVKQSIVNAFLTLAGIGGILTIAFLVSTRTLASGFFHSPKIEVFLYYFGASIPFYLFLRLTAVVFGGFKNMRALVFFRDISRQGLIFLFLVVFWLLSLPGTHLGSIYLVGLGTGCAIAALTARRRLPAELKGHSVSLRAAGAFLKFSGPLMFVNVIMMSLHYTDTILLARFLDQEQVGIYNAAVPLADLLGVVYESFIPLTVPVMTTYFARKNGAFFRDVYSISCKWIYILTLPCYVLVLLYPEFLIHLMFGQEYISAARVLQVLSSGIFFSALVGPVGNVLIVIGRPKLVLLNSVGALVINVALNIVLIPIHGLLGAATATMISVLLYNGVALAQVFYLQRIVPPLSVYARISMAAAVPAACMAWLLPAMNFTGFVGATVAFLGAYLALNILLKTISADDKIILNEIKKQFG